MKLLANSFVYTTILLNRRLLYMSGNVRVMKWLTAGYEAFLGIPLIGGAFIMSFSWGPLVFAFFLHAIALFLSHKEGRSAYGNILGMVTSFVGVIPVVGMVMHIITAIVIAFEAAKR